MPFCSRCGARTASQPNPPKGHRVKQVKYFTCSRCGVRPAEGARYCPGCGGRFRVPIGPAITEYVPKGSKSDEPFPIMLVVSLLIVIPTCLVLAVTFVMAMSH